MGAAGNIWSADLMNLIQAIVQIPFFQSSTIYKTYCTFNTKHKALNEDDPNNQNFLIKNIFYYILLPTLLPGTKFNLGWSTRAAVIRLNFQAGSTFPVPVCTVPTALWTGLASARLSRSDFMLHKGWIYFY